MSRAETIRLAADLIEAEWQGEDARLGAGLVGTGTLVRELLEIADALPALLAIAEAADAACDDGPFIDDCSPMARLRAALSLRPNAKDQRPANAGHDMQPGPGGGPGAST
jgi:hypothetical protein